jgi:hypothetical protein
MPRYRASWRESTKLLPATLPNQWLYRCTDFESRSREEAQVTARQILPPTAELLEILDVDALVAGSSAATEGATQPAMFSGRRRRAG